MTFNWSPFWLTAGLVVSLAGCITFAYLWIDRSITLSYTNQSFETVNSSAVHLASLLQSEWHGRTKDEVLKILKIDANRRPEGEILVKEDEEQSTIWFDNVRFIFKSNRLVAIEK